MPNLLGGVSKLIIISLAVLLLAKLFASDNNPVLTPIFNGLQEGFYSILGGLLYHGLRLWSSTRTAVQNGTLVLPGLHDSVKIIRDEWGIPHIYAQNRDDLLFAQGFVHAQDRLWQMDINRRLASGRLSELFGEVSLETDRIVRTIGFLRRARKDIVEFTEDEKQTTTAYVKGINAYLNSPYFTLPIEYTSSTSIQLLLTLKVIRQSTVAPWTTVDVAALMRSLYWQMHKGWAMELVRQALLNAVGESRTNELERFFTESMPTHIKSLRIDLDAEHDKEQFFQHTGGSNGWVVSGNRTLTGKPILSNDVHLALTNPSIWYENRLVDPSMDVLGATIPGVGLVIIGHNNKVAWGVTLANIDSDDLYVEKFVDYPHTYLHKGNTLNSTITEEIITVKGRTEPHVEQIIETVHGPIISKVLGGIEGEVAMCSVALIVPSAMRAFIQLPYASNWNEFVKVVEGITAPSLNIIFASTTGDIGYYVSGRAPHRHKPHKGIAPVPGWTGEYDWDDAKDGIEMPHVLNPEEGFIVSANHPVIPQNANDKWFFGHSFSQAYRAQRLYKVVESKNPITIQDCIDLQMDVTSIAAIEFVSRVTAMNLNSSDPDIALALQLLKKWDGRLTVDSVAATVYHVVKNATMFNLLQPELGTNMTLMALGKGIHPLLRSTNEYIGFDTTALFRMLDNSSSWWIQNAGGKEALFNKSIKEGIQWLRNKFGNDATTWKWGKIHRIVFKHALGSKRPLDVVFNQGPFEWMGDTDTPLLSVIQPGTYDGFVMNPTYKQIIDMSDMAHKSIAVNAPGQSGMCSGVAVDIDGCEGELGSKHWDDQLKLWMNGEFHPMLVGTPQEIASNNVLTLQSQQL